MAVEVTSTGVQIHGGMGFVEETGAAQYYRDARILPIYEGTNGIQALDLVFRKNVRDQGAAIHNYISEMKEFCNGLNDENLSMKQALENLTQATDWILSQDMSKAEEVSAVCVPYLKLFGYTVAGYMLARSASVTQADEALIQDKRNTAHFYMTHILPMAIANVKGVLQGSDCVLNAKF
jgi:hypothetical protein